MGGEATRTEDNVQPRLPPAVATRYWSTKMCSRRKTLSQRKDGRKDASFSRYILVRERGGRESTLRRGSGRGATGRRTQGRAPPSSVREIARVLRGPVYRRVCREGGGTTFLARDVSGLPLRPRLSKGARSAAGGRLAETPPRTGTEQLPEASNHRSRGAIPLGGLDRGQHPERTITDGGLAQTLPWTGTERRPEASNRRSQGAILMGGLERIADNCHPERTIISPYLTYHSKQKP